jgi:hypothetical protein
VNPSQLFPNPPYPASRSSPEQAELFYQPLLSSYLDGPGIVPRPWLDDEIRDRLARPTCRYVLIIGEPGAGKTGYMAELARSNPGWLRYFVRLDSTTPLSSSDAVSMMLRIGHQLAHLRPEVFDPELLEIEVEQRIEQAGPGASVVGVKIDDLRVSPFYRTAIRVQQKVTTLEGGMAGIEIARATAEPRLLEVDTLSHLALLDPAGVLARKSPGSEIVILIDALDEVINTRSTNTVLDWLETSEAPPANIRFVLTSRPHARLRTLESVRGDSLEIVRLEERSDLVTTDVRSFATRLFEDTRALERSPQVNRELAITSLARTAQGNFAYLTAYARSLRAALASGSVEQVAELLEFETLPSGLPQLYAAFARRMRRQIEALGYLEIESPRGPGDETVLAWEGVGQRLLGLLSVAFAPLTQGQLITLGGIRVWESAVSSVLQTLAPFLDEGPSGWKLFHSSVGEFLTSAEQQGQADVSLNPHEWHTRILRYYRGAGSWADVSWDKVDSYGLLHVAGHLAAISDEPTAVVELITPSLRAASKQRFLSDLPFRRTVETARASIRASKDVGLAVTDGIFLALVAAGLSEGAELLDPAVYGLMARLGRVEEALARAQVLESGTRKYRTLEAIWQCTPAGSRSALGPLDGIELLVGAAIEISPAATSIVGGQGYDLATCLSDAAVKMVRHDLNRALSLAEWADRYDRAEKATDAVLAEAAVTALPAKALELLNRMQEKRAATAVSAAEKASGTERDQLVAVAMAHLKQDETSTQLPLVARLIALLNRESSDTGRQSMQSLRTTMDQLLAESESSRSSWGVVSAAEILHDADSQLAMRVLRTCDRPEVDSLLADTLVDAARLWVAWGKPDEARLCLTKALDAYRALGWYGPAGNIAEAAGVAGVFDSTWREQLAQEAITLIQPELSQSDSMELSRVNGTLSTMVRSFREYDRPRALQAAHWMGGSWIPGAGWDSTDGRGGALAMIALDVVDKDPELAAKLLSECLADEKSSVHFGRTDSRWVPTGLFAQKQEAMPTAPGNLRAVNALAYLNNCVNYWASGRKWRYFHSPVEVLRSMEEVFPATASWARVVAACIPSVAAVDLDQAAAMTWWIADPAEQLPALAALARALESSDGQGEEKKNRRFPDLWMTMRANLADLPEYAPEADLHKIPQGPVLWYLDPTVRARFEAALLISRESDAFHVLPNTEDFWYLNDVLRAEALYNNLLDGVYSRLAPDEFARQMDAISDGYGRSDDLLRDLLEMAGSFALSINDRGRGRARLERIANPSIKATAQLLLVEFDHSGASSMGDEMLKVLASAEVSSMHQAHLAATGTLLCEASGQLEHRLLDWGLSQLDSADAFERCHGLSALAAVAPGERRASLVSQALSFSEQIGNVYMRNDALAGLLGSAVATGDGALIADILARLFDSGWTAFMDGLYRATPQIVDAAGPEIVDKMDAAMRRAQTVSATGPSPDPPLDHFDGVLPPLLREGVLRSAAERTSKMFGPYLSTFLDQTDVDPSLRWVQDSRIGRPDPDDEAFDRLHGSQSGLSVWLSDVGSAIWRMVDIRFLFNTPAEAATYHRERLQANSEGKPPLSEFPAVGEDCHVFGGAESIATTGAVSICMTSYYYVFRVGRVVVKLFAAQGQESAESLRPEHLRPLAERIVEKVNAAGLAGESVAGAA